MKRYHLALSLTISLSACSDATQFSEKNLGQVIEDESLSEETSINQDNPSVATEGISADGVDGAKSQTQSAASQTAPVPAPAPAQEALLSVCEQGTKKTLTQAIRFPESRNCRWNTAGNLGRKDAFLQAMEVQTSTITLPER
ncbi:MAG: hypothetical protein ACOVS5_10010, partial [Oligoflexus sp.]